MKKIVIFLFNLLPLLFFSQTDLVKWGNHNTLTTSYVASNISSAPITASGVSLVGAYSQHNTSTDSAHWTTAAAVDLSQYVQFSVTANAGFQIQPSSFEFVYEAPSLHVRKFQIRYATDASFSGGGTTLIGATATLSGNQTVVGNFPSSFKVLPEETLYIRFYAYDNAVTWHSPILFKHNGNANNGPKIRGTVTPFVNLLTAIDDIVYVAPNQLTPINVLQNDVEGNAPISSVGLTAPPAHGTVLWNATTQRFNYTPQNSYLGEDIFTYTIANGVDPDSTATVHISVQGTTPLGALCGSYIIDANYGHFLVSPMQWHT